MVKLVLLHDIDCNKEAFWKSYFDPVLSKRLFLEGLAFRDYAVSSQTEDEKTIRRTVSVEPTVALPAALSKLLGSQFRYTEEGTFDKATETFRWKLVPSTMADKIRVDGTMTATPKGEKVARRVELESSQAEIVNASGLHQPPRNTRIWFTSATPWVRMVRTVPPLKSMP